VHDSLDYGFQDLNVSVDLVLGTLLDMFNF